MTTALAPRSVAAVLPDGRKPVTIAPEPIGEGADATIHRVEGHPDFVAKLYREPGDDDRRRAKLEAMLAAVPDGRVTAQGGTRVVELAWPETLLEADDATRTAVGFVMPAVDLRDAVLLEALLSPRGRRAEGLTESVRFRLSAAANLASAVASLHAAGHHVIDLKPSNLHVYRTSALVAVLDCDGMSVAGPDGTRFPAHRYTDGTIAPEALRARSRPEDLGEAQDRFALTVVLFQLLNNGLHPFQGVPNPAAGPVPTTDGERIEAGLYPYGSAAHTLAPPPSSPFPYLDARTQTLFGRAFDGSAEGRPTAAEWRDHLRELLASGLSPCEESRDHARFEGRACAACELDPVVQKRRRRAAFEARRAPQLDLPPWAQSNDELTGAFWGVAVTSAAALIVISYVLARSVLALFDPADSYPAAQTGISLAGAIEHSSEADFFRLLVENPDALNVRDAEALQPPYNRLYVQRGRWARGVTYRMETQAFPHLHHASLLAKPYFVAALVDRMHNVDAVDMDERTALMYAASTPGVDYVLDDDYQSKVARYAFRQAARIRETPQSPRYERHPEDVLSPIQSQTGQMSWGTVVNRSIVIELLLASGADVTARDSWGRTALHYAAATGNGPTASQLIRAGANPNATDITGVTPLMAAADAIIDSESDRLGADLSRLLVLNGADASQRDAFGRTAGDFVGSTKNGTVSLSHSVTLALLDQVESSRPGDVSWIPAYGAHFSVAPIDLAQRHDIGDRMPLQTLATSLSAPLWVRNAPIEVQCLGVAGDRFEAELTVTPTDDHGVAKRESLRAPGWIGDMGLTGSLQDPDERRARAEEIRDRERCLIRAKRSLPSRFDVRGLDALSGPVEVVVNGG